ncbi:hypothetical protein ACFL5Y_02220 [Candidatus Omnitrophota bacterium]
MKRLLFFVFTMVICVTGASAYPEDAQREEALKQFDTAVNGGTKLVDTVQPFSRKEMYEQSIPPAPVWYDWDDPFFGPENELDYEIWRAHQED